jgi:hypothetical protein
MIPGRRVNGAALGAILSGRVVNWLRSAKTKQLRAPGFGRWIWPEPSCSFVAFAPMIDIRLRLSCRRLGE